MTTPAGSFLVAIWGEKKWEALPRSFSASCGPWLPHQVLGLAFATGLLGRFFFCCSIPLKKHEFFEFFGSVFFFWNIFFDSFAFWGMLIPSEGLGFSPNFPQVGTPAEKPRMLAFRMNKKRSCELRARFTQKGLNSSPGRQPFQASYPFIAGNQTHVPLMACWKFHFHSHAISFNIMGFFKGLLLRILIILSSRKSKAIDIYFVWRGGGGL